MERFFLTIALLAVFVPTFAYAQKGQSAKGAQLFQQLCVGCHGADGRAQADAGKKVGAADLTSSVVQDQSDSQLSKVIKDGRGKMPTWGGKLSDDDIRDLVAYIRQFRPTEKR